MALVAVYVQMHNERMTSDTNNHITHTVDSASIRSMFECFVCCSASALTGSGNVLHAAGFLRWSAADAFGCGRAIAAIIAHGH